MKFMIGQMGKTNGFYSAAGGVLENASIVPNALQEMLMQSHEGVIRFFPQSISDPASRAPLADPDSDGSGNLLEFAFGGDPIDSMSRATANGMLTAFGQEQALTITVPVRAGAIFSAGTSGSLKAEVDGITCIIEGSSDLENWTASVLEITPSLPDGQPAIPSGYEYHTFRLSGSASEHDRAFLRMRALQPQ